jgi:RNA polymerase sigma-70 factor (ECF subfamily)
VTLTSPASTTTVTASTTPSTASGSAREASFARLYDETAPRVYGLVLRVVRDPALAERVTREVYLRAWSESGWRDGSETTAVRLMTLAHRRAVDTMRSTGTFRPARAERPVDRRAVVPGLESAASRRARVALDLLPADVREALDLAYGGGHTHTEVADLIGVGSAQVLIRDGLHRVRQALD